MTELIVNIALALLVASAGLTLVRIFLGPTGLDRALCMDVAVIIATGVMAVSIVRTGDAGALPVLVVFSLTGFVGSVAVARFMAREEDPK